MYIKTESITNRVIGIYSNNEKEGLIYVESIPQAEDKEGYFPIMYYRNDSIVYEYEPLPEIEPEPEPTIDKRFEVEEKIKSMFFYSAIPNIINTMEISDEDSLVVKDFYPTWQSFINKELPKGYKVTFIKSGETEPTLYKVIQTVATVLEHQTPDLVPSNYEVIDETHEGTITDPIPYKKPMRVYKDKYYTYNKVLYICIKDSGDPLQYTPDEVIGHFFNKA